MSLTGSETLEWLKDERIEDAVLGNHEAMVLKTLMNRERRTRTGWMGQLNEVQTEEWIQALWRLPVAMTVATEHGDVGIVHPVVIDRSWHRTIEGIERRDQAVISTALLGDTEASGAGDREHPSRACGLSSRATSPSAKLRPAGTGGRSTPEPDSRGSIASRSFGSTASRWEPYTVDAVAVERVTSTDDGGRE